MTPLAVRLMLRALAVALICWLAAAIWGVLQLREDVNEELEAALALARTLDAVTDSRPGDLWPREAVALRHLTLTVRDADGRLLLQRPAPAALGEAGGLDFAVEALAHWLPEPPLAPHVRTLPRPSGDWTLTVAPDADSERREALAELLRNLGVMGLAVGMMLAVMAITLRQALGPLHRLAQAIGGIRPGATASAHDLVQRLAMASGHGVREVREVSIALQALALALDQADTDRKVLAQRLLSAQEAERARLARELHDEWGQHLTALRLDAAWLRQHRGEGIQDAVQRIADACAHLQRDLQQQLRRLSPRDLQTAGDAQTLEAALTDLAQAWDGSGTPPLRVAVRWHDARSPLQRCHPLPAELLLTLYRLSQEALTNAVRHARARQACVAVRLDDTGVDWSAEDDGVGVPDPSVAMRRGSGLAQLRERAWAHGADLQFGPGEAGRGMRLSARFDASAMPAVTAQTRIDAERGQVR